VKLPIGEPDLSIDDSKAVRPAPPVLVEEVTKRE
jgi:hypothetical protein